MFNTVSDGLEHAPNLPIYSLEQDNAKTRRRQGTKVRNFRTLAIKKNSAQQLRSKRRIPRSIQRDFIFLIYLKTRVGEALRQLTVIREEQQTLSLRVQTANSEKVGKFFWYEVKNSVTRAQILSSRNESGGFI